MRFNSFLTTAESGFVREMLQTRRVELLSETAALSLDNVFL
ncbi:MAG: hypothetical protein A07HR60_01311 [uncultured archaeon A07HR60]|jgi:hypothetical protein|nr:MAG: hypothetical protein A07HR60_01311 [uncultured archaeon A07HR60]